MKRRSPIRHKVKTHTRNGKRVRSFTRGRGSRIIRKKVRVITKKSKISPQHIFTSRYEMEKAIETEKIPTFEKVVVRIKDQDYTLLVEEWWDDCMESRGLGKTTESSIERNYVGVMEKESGLQAHKHRYMSSRLAEYGLTYIMQRV